ncbi:uncharacterized protein BDZ99DRAFT_516675 [Mytilinidion resinicola]|uniref:Uncharacterized protein n=1 Tax=Mytilinidion resinicola TaxID=574789 RepID=A0A6A6Z196_9PEZI|nr:uncharacterized protein BDZ99DRAFT_516675 [Mytilinidion resinicola]KAF2814054.1 hypothetical protein BDZ99DRAFT_516675 [Mytilinidion resinicola]
MVQHTPVPERAQQGRTGDQPWPMDMTSWKVRGGAECHCAETRIHRRLRRPLEVESMYGAALLVGANGTTISSTPPLLGVATCSQRPAQPLGHGIGIKRNHAASHRIMRHLHTAAARQKRPKTARHALGSDQAADGLMCVVAVREDRKRWRRRAGGLANGLPAVLAQGVEGS